MTEISIRRQERKPALRASNVKRSKNNVEEVDLGVCKTSHEVSVFFFFQAEDGIRDLYVTGVSDVCSSDLSKLQKRPEAIALFRQAIERGPKNYWEAHYALGEELAFDGQTKDAAQEFAEVIRIRPGIAMADRKSVV